MNTQLIRAMLAGAAVAGFTASTEATELHFDGLGLPNYGVIPQSYGDNLPGTEQITVSYRTRDAAGTTIEDHVEYWQSSYGDLTDVAFPGQNGYLAEITLEAAPGYAVFLRGFDLAGYPGAVQQNQTVQILDENYAILQDYSPWDVTGQGHDHFSPLLTGDTLRIVYGPSWNSGIDNIAFDQKLAVPEPKTYALLAGLGLIGFAGYRRMANRR